MADKTIFSRIIDGEVPARIEHEDSHCVVIHDINPQAPVHLLVIPKRRINRISTAADDDTEILGHLLQVSRRVADRLGLEKGFRLVINNGPDGCESVPHLHIHLLAGRQMAWPPG